MSAPSSTRERFRRLLALAAAAVAGAALTTAASGASPEATADEGEITVAAAMSLRNVLPPLIDVFQRSNPGKVVATYGASGDLRRQVEGGAPIDAVVFADAADVELLIERGQIEGGKHVVASNSLVLIAPRGAGPLTFEGIDAVAQGEYIAIGAPKTVPAGRYAKQALEALQKWDAIEDRLVFGGHVAAVLQYVRRGEVAAAVVYSTDVIGIDDVVVLDRAQGAWAPRIETVAAVVAEGKEAEAIKFIDFLETPAARAIFASHGFGPPGGSPAEARP